MLETTKVTHHSLFEVVKAACCSRLGGEEAVEDVQGEEETESSSSLSSQKLQYSLSASSARQIFLNVHTSFLSCVQNFNAQREEVIRYAIIIILLSSLVFAILFTVWQKQKQLYNTLHPSSISPRSRELIVVRMKDVNKSLQLVLKDVRQHGPTLPLRPKELIGEEIEDAHRTLNSIVDAIGNVLVLCQYM